MAPFYSKKKNTSCIKIQSVMIAETSERVLAMKTEQ